MSNEPAPSLTAQQARPLDVRGASVALSAGAGCGKTTVLTERFVRALSRPGGGSLRALAALTFTDKAARELRGRIRAECRKRLGAGDDAPYWRAVLRALEAAPVGTFHEFCARWLRRRALEARVDPEFAVLEAPVAATLRHEALNAALRRQLSERSPELVLLAAEFGMRPVREALATLLARRDADALGPWADCSAEEIVAVWRAVWEREEKPRLFADVVALGREVAEVLDELEHAHPKLVALRAHLLGPLRELAELADDDAGLAAVRGQAYMPKGLKAEHWPSEQINKAVKSGLQCLRDAVDDYRKRCAWNESAALEAAEHGRRFARLALAARAEYTRRKRERGGLDFDDLLLATRALLRGAGEAERAAMAGSLELLLVDEFQDTDPVQDEILQLLAGTGYLDGKLFVVGDFKQSIYRFRGAEPRIFQRTRAAFPEDGRHELTENFRSVPEILDFVNALFHGAFDSHDMPPLVSGKKPAPALGQVPAVEFLWAAEPHDGAAKLKARPARQLEARWLARHVRSLIDAGRPVRDRATGLLRPMGPGDVALLFRALTDVAPYETALRDEGLDYYTVGGSAFYVQQEINDLINILSTIEDPYDAVSLAGALRGPFFGISDDGLYWLATAQRDLTEGIDRAADVPNLSDLDRQHAFRARSLLDRWRGLKDHTPIAALIDRVLDESGYEAALLAERLGDRKRANARKLVRMARAYDRQGGFTLAQFVASLRDELRDPSREEQAATTDETGDCVRLMSIHAAKGLEFPVVVLPDLNRKASEQTPCAAFDPELGPLVRASKERDGIPGAEDEEGLGWRLYRARERREEEAEALRLFYVATTRARDWLVLSAAVRPADSVQSAAMRLLDARFDRATGLCLRELPPEWGVPRVAVVGSPPDATAGGRARPPRIEVEDVARVIDEAQPDDGARTIVARRRPALVDLDPGRALSGTPARVDRLVRALLAEPKHLTAAWLPDAARRLALRQVPAAHPGLVDDAVRKMLPWVDGALGRILAGAERIEAGASWTVAWPPEVQDRTVFLGRTDLLVQERDGHWSVVQISDPSAPAPLERLRTLLAAHAAVLTGRGPVRQAWHIVLGPDGRLTGEERFDSAAIEAAIVAAL